MAYQDKVKDKSSVKQMLKQKKKENKKKLKEKRARLVVKNLPFEATEENLREYFAKYGDITDIKMLKKEDNTLLGCAFVQYKFVQKARKAKHHTDGQPFLGRHLEVEFAIAKKTYEEIQVKKEKEFSLDKVKQEPIDAEEIKQEKDNIDEGNQDTLQEEDAEEGEESPDESSDEEISKDASSENESCSGEKLDDLNNQEKRKTVSNDVTEGKTIFIKNVPFTATNEDLKKCITQFGPVYYALICMDKFTEHSKGTAFVKFHLKEDAEKALQAGTELTLMGNVLDCHRALDKKEILLKQEEKNNKKDVRDSRNLYLVKEGVIIAGTKAAEGVSGSDMMKRLQLEQYKTQILKNLNMFVSRVRLVIHNIPSKWDDKKLRILCSKFVPKGSKIKEARIMRNMNDVDAKGIGKSKEFGFVTVDSHEGAITLLRNLNNNPNIFSKSKRPIVAFSIEKRSAINTKLKRLERSKFKNPKSKHYNPNLVREENSKKTRTENVQTEETLEEYSGIPAKPGVQKMRGRYKLNTQAMKHYENLKKEKKEKKMAKKTLAEKRIDFRKQEKQKINKSKYDTDDFSKLVSQYKRTISSAPVVKKKWYS